MAQRMPGARQMVIDDDNLSTGLGDANGLGKRLAARPRLFVQEKNSTVWRYRPRGRTAGPTSRTVSAYGCIGQALPLRLRNWMGGTSMTSSCPPHRHSKGKPWEKSP